MRPGLVLRALAGVAGVALFLLAVRYAAVRSIDVRPTTWVRWWVTAAVLHDLVVAPAALLVGWLAVRFVPRVAKAPVQAGLILSALLVVVSWPALRGYGRIASNPTYLPRNYATGLLLSLALVWVASAVWTLGRVIRQRQT